MADPQLLGHAGLRQLSVTSELSEHLRELPAKIHADYARGRRQFEEFQRLEAQREADKEHRLQAQVACQVYVSERLKAPSSAEFSPSATIVPRDEGGYLIRGVVDAQNAFGAKLRRDYLCAIDPAGQVMSGTVVE